MHSGGELGASGNSRGTPTCGGAPFRRPLPTPGRVTAAYVTAGLLWIVLSDVLLDGLIGDSGLRLYLQLSKGWLFVGLSGVLIFWLSRMLTGAVAAKEEERRHAKAALRAALVEAERANMVKSEFLATVNHEFRTPLNAILGFSEALQVEMFGPLSVKYAEYATYIHASGLLIKKMVDDMLTLVELEERTGAIGREHLDLHALLARSLEAFEAWAEEAGVTLTLDLRGSPRAVYGDRPCVMRIVSNLLANAVTSTRRGGRIVLSAATSGDGCAIVVRDSGGGIPPDRLPTITEPFSNALPNPSLARNHSGLGLGLAVVKALAEAHGGRLRLASSADEGTTATVWFPAPATDA